MTDSMNPPPLGLKRLEELKELKRKLGLHLKFETDDSGLWNEYVFSYAINFYTLFHKHYMEYPDFISRAVEAARHNAVESAIDVIKKQLYNFRSLQPVYEKKIFERLGEHIQREEDKRKPEFLAPPRIPAPSLSLTGAVPVLKLLPRNDVSTRRRAFIQPLLDAKGWDVAKWAEKAKVSRHTANDYLEGKRKTYHRSMVDLATALGVSFQDFPK